MGVNESKIPYVEEIRGIFVGPERPGESRILRHPNYVENFLESPGHGIKKMNDLYQYAFQTHASRPMFGTVHEGQYV